jgi:hypothetical protein
MNKKQDQIGIQSAFNVFVNCVRSKLVSLSFTVLFYGGIKLCGSNDEIQRQTCSNKVLLGRWVKPADIHIKILAQYCGVNCVYQRKVF